jgi:fermentation-respiration switch protein FrsA (DUF1100 family)
MVSIGAHRLMWSIVFVAAMALLLAAAITAGIWFFQERITFQPQGPPFPDDSAALKLQYTADDGQPLFAYVVGEPDSTTSLLIAFHGNADLALRQIDWAHEIVRRAGVPVMLVEYRGYMGLPGRPTYQGSKLDAVAAYRFALAHFHVDPTRIVFFGHSLGTAIATELALQHRPAALILQSPFTSARDMGAIIAGKWVTSLTWRFVSRVHYDTVDGVSSLDIPVSVVHGGRDRVIPSRMGKAVYAAAKNKGVWLFVPTASHSDVPLRAGDAYWDWMMSALAPVIRQ